MATCQGCKAQTPVLIRGVCRECYNNPATRPVKRCKSCLVQVPEGWRFCSVSCARDDEGY